MKKGLVLSGGGAKGAYQLGVWQALRELKLEFDVVTGTSIGSLNGALYVQGDYEKARELWFSVTPQDVVDVEQQDPKLAERDILLKAFSGGASTKPLENLLRAHIDEDVIRNSPIRFGIVTVSFPNIAINYLPIDKIEPGYLHRHLVASSTVFPAFKPTKIHDKYYIDGGFQDNLPINLAIEMGAKDILAIDLKSMGFKKKTKLSDAKIRVIQPSRPLGSSLLFDNQLAKKNAQLGYLDTLRHFGKLKGSGIYFKAKSYQRYAGKIQKEFLDSINRALEGRENDFFDLFRVVSNLFLFRRARLDENVDNQKLLLHAIDQIACMASLDDLEIYTFASFYKQVKLVLDDISQTSSDLKQVRGNIVYIKNALKKDTLNPRFYFGAVTNPGNALAAFLAVAAEQVMLSNHKALKDV